MFLGMNAAEFGAPTSSSGHKYALQDGCVDCHMYATPDTGKPGRDKIGGHTWAMEADGVENVAACQSCHGPIKSFDDIKAAYDYDRNGKVEGIQTEVKGMLARLGNILPKQVADSGKVLQSFTQNQLRAAYNYFFVQNDGSHGVHNAKYAIGLLQKSMDILTGVETVNYSLPETYTLTQNFPNPFNPTTEIQFGVPWDSKVQIIIYDIVGRKVRTLVDNPMIPGTYRATWDGRDDNGLGVASGVYLYRIVAKNSSGSGQDFVLTKKMILMK
jgi:cytochrome c551/c552